MRRSLFISSFRFQSLPGSVLALLSFVFVFWLGNFTLLKVGPYFDSNFVSMHTVNDDSWIEGGDILLLGDSRAQQGLVPDEFKSAFAQRGVKLKAFNLGRPGMQVPFTYFFSKRAQETSEHPPKVIVVNFSFYLLGGQQWMENVYWAYYRPSFSEAYQSCMMQLLQCPDAAEWWFRTRLPAWMFKSRANSFIREAISSPTSLKTQLAGIYNMQRLARFDVARGYLSRGFSHITQDDVAPHQYITGIERGYSTYLKYLNQMLTEFSAAGVEVYVFRFPWPESRKMKKVSSKY